MIDGKGRIRRARRTRDQPGKGHYVSAVCAGQGGSRALLERLPFSIRILLEGVLRSVDGELVTENDVRNLARWSAAATPEAEVPFMPARVLLQDLTGGAGRGGPRLHARGDETPGGDPRRINPLVPVDLVIDHSVQVDFAGSPDALKRNMEIEFERNRERFEFLRWARRPSPTSAWSRPPRDVHQVNLEFLAKVVMTRRQDGRWSPSRHRGGNHSHTTMINGLGVLGWGVGGIEAEPACSGSRCNMVALRSWA